MNRSRIAVIEAVPGPSFHEACGIFPMMSESEFLDLKDDVEAHGQREPIWMWNGRVIDGRNRWRACLELGLTPEVRQWDGVGSLVEFVVSLNLHRRHLTSGQRAACTTEIEEQLAAEAKERQRASGGDRKSPGAKGSVEANLPQPIASGRRPQARDEAARLIRCSARYIQDAKAVKAASPELHEQVKAGTIKLYQARREVDRIEKRADLASKAAAAEAARAAGSAPSWEIRHGDCLDVLRSIEPGSVRLIFADPPYNLGVDYGDHHDDDRPPGEYLALCRGFIGASVPLLTPDGSLWVLINHEWAARVELMLVEAGLEMRDWITWFESFGVNCSNKFNRCSRRLLHAVKDPDRFVFNPDAVRRPSDRQARYDDPRADPAGKIWDDVWGINPPIPRLVGNASERLADFPNQLPLALVSAVVGCATDPGDLVVDPFSGTGTTCEASLRLGRRSIGIEKSSEYVRFSRMRLVLCESARTSKHMK